MLSWIAMSVGEKLGDKNKSGPPVVSKKEAKLKAKCAKQMAKDLSRADDDGFIFRKNKIDTPPTADQDSDCWSELWQNVSDAYSRLKKSKSKGERL